MNTPIDNYVFSPSDMVQPTYKILYLPGANFWEKDFQTSQEAEAYLKIALNSFYISKRHLFEIEMH